MPSQVLGRRVAMLEPLDPQRLDALLRDVGDDADCLNIRAAKEYFAMNDMAEGLLALIDSFGFKPRLYHEEGNFAKWKILFRVRAHMSANANINTEPHRILHSAASAFSPAQMALSTFTHSEHMWCRPKSSTILRIGSPYCIGFGVTGNSARSSD